MSSLCHGLTRRQSNQLYTDVLHEKNSASMARLCQDDLFFLLSVALRRKDVNRDWLYDRCREVEENPDGIVDLWSRGHYKSTIITFGKTIQDILANPDVTVGIFSHTRPIAKGFLEQIKREFEINSFLKALFPDVLYQDPQREAPTWSLDNGILVKRKSNPKEKTIEAWGLVDGQPTSKHYSLRVYDDVVTRESVTTPEQIQKVTDAWELSLNLGSENGRVRYIGTRYHLNDTWKVIMDRKAATPRIHRATKDGAPVLLTVAELDKKRSEMGPYTYACQMEQNPVADKAMAFREEWLSYYNFLRNHERWNYYIVVDAANAKKKKSDYTVMLVIGLAQDGNYYLVDAIRDRLNLTERAANLFKLHRKWRPLAVGYEQYGMQTDVEHIRYEMELQSYRFNIIELGGQMAKEDRIRRLIPKFETHKVFLPNTLMFRDNEGKMHDFIREFVQEEYLAFPVSPHDDMLDCFARILEEELDAKFPTNEDIQYATDENLYTCEMDYDPLGGR